MREHLQVQASNTEHLYLIFTRIVQLTYDNECHAFHVIIIEISVV